MRASGTWKNWRWLMLGLLQVLALFGCEQVNPAPGLIDDRAGLLTRAEQRQLGTLQSQLLKQIDVHLWLVILDQPAPDLDATARELFEEFGRESLVRGARGVLLLVDPEGNQVRMEIGYDLEGIFPDAFIGYIEMRQMAPFFASGRVADGIAATTELLVGKALKGEEPAESATSPLPLRHAGGGAGARIPVAIGAGAASAVVATQSDRFRAQPTPLATLDLYRQVLRLRLKDPDLDLYTTETRQFLRRWLVTDVQQDNELAALDAAWSHAAVISNGPLAVIRFPIEERRNPPYFLHRKNGGWHLDIAAMNRLVAFNHRNQWHFRNLDHGYMFGFSDWQFDVTGFPHRGMGGRR
ncbi:TPM domain-containing protein [Desulfuromonas sp. DDH964]|uniref:TPM domain-containing protein n=1 Tax=Desulfuromonas sp. DDH964 TaxID=1823759 RepID=UPI0012F9E7CF|nr:TPM domain-containing protein [Desulfuromonas sp. DDH964]